MTAITDAVNCSSNVERFVLSVLPKNVFCLFALATCFMLLSAPAIAEERDRIYMDETVISGNQELPRVLYILPWRNDPGQVPAAVAPVMDRLGLMKPLNPQEYQREIALRELVGQLGSATPIKE